MRTITILAFAIGAAVLGFEAVAIHAMERDAICRQDGQGDVISIQLNVEFNCYCETDSECEFH